MRALADKAFNFTAKPSNVDLVQVDVRGLQPLQTRFHRLHHTFSVVAGRVRIYARRSVGVFRGQHPSLAIVHYELAEKRFARSVCTPSLPRPWPNPTPFSAEGHGPECRLENSKARVAQ